MNQLKVLIAEDDIWLRDIWRQKITQAGFNVVTAKDGAETMEKIEKEKPDLLLLDIVMPAMNGFDVLKKIKEHPEKKINQIAVIVLSNLDSQDDIKKVQSFGVDRYMVKAMFSVDDVIQKIVEHQRKISNS